MLSPSFLRWPVAAGSSAARTLSDTCVRFAGRSPDAGFPRPVRSRIATGSADTGSRLQEAAAVPRRRYFDREGNGR